VRDVGRVQRRFRGDAPGAGAEGREKIPNSRFSFPPTPAGLAAHPGNSDYFRVIPSNSDHRKNLRTPSTEECHAEVNLSTAALKEVEALAKEDAGNSGRLCNSPRCVYCVLSRSIAAIKSPFLRFLRIFAAIQSKRLSMNHLHPKTALLQSR
jgi:hypothetical protein